MDDFEADWLAMTQGGGGYAPSEFDYGNRGYDSFETDWNAQTQGGFSPGEQPRADSGLSWWDSSYTYTPQQSFNYTPLSYGLSYGAGTGTSPAMSYDLGYGGSSTGAGSTFGAASSGSGSGPGVTLGSGGFGSGSFATAPVAGNAGVTGALGVGPDAYDLSGTRINAMDQQPTLAQYAERGATALREGAGYVKDKAGGALSAVKDYARDDPMGARLGLEGAGLLLGAYNQRAANKEARRVNDMQSRDRENLRALQAEQMQMQREAYERNMQQLERNNQQADQWNQQATQSANEARSNFNPQEMAIRAMAQQQMGTQNLITEGERDMRRRGMSDAAIAAETRRARLGGTTGATTAYTRGLDVGRQAQQAALSGASGLARTYGSVGAAPGLTTSLGGTADYSLANTLSKSGADTTANLKALLNLYLGDPITRSDQEIRRQTQKESLQ